MELAEIKLESMASRLLDLAILDADSSSKRLRIRAVKWLTTEDHEIFGIDSVCSILGLNGSYFRKLASEKWSK